MKKQIKFAVLMSLTVLSLNSCRNNADESDVLESRDYATGENSYEDLQTIADQAHSGSTDFLKSGGTDKDVLSGSCATVTRDTIAVPHTITIDFGPTNCLGNDGRYRRGIVNVTYTGAYRAPGTIITITPQNYYVNDNQINGFRTITNEGPDNNGNYVFNIVVNGEIIKANNGGTVTWNAQKTRTWISGYNTPEWSDDVYLVTGHVDGVSATGKNYHAETLTPLRRQMDCKWFTEGKLQIQVNTRPVRVVDFGSSNCDNQATVTINGSTRTITLP